MCVSVIHFKALQFSYSCEEDDRLHLILDTEAEGALEGGGEEAATGYFTHCRMSSLHLVLPSPLSHPMLLEM